MSGSRPFRVEGWEGILCEVIENSKDRPFVYGTFDCCLFAGDCILAVTGIDHMAEFRNAYNNKREAHEAIKRVGGLPNRITELFGDPIPAGLAMRGDIVCIEDRTVGICMGGVALAPSSAGGLVPSGRSKWTMAWKVGRS